ncbi:hypothetical protein Q9966_011031 [Columba livia]|nr:hypothetical protein Q9966_011031 [Columba livia]
MYAAVEHGPVLCSDSNILCLSWKGRVPKSEKEKPVCRRRYYEEGWLATGNGRGVVGVTFTSSHCRRDRNTPQRINFNLRGHNSEAAFGCGLSKESVQIKALLLGETGVAGVEPVSEMLSKLRTTLAFVKLSKHVGDLVFTVSQEKATVSSTDVVSREDNGQQQKTQLKANYWPYGGLLGLMP